MSGWKRSADSAYSAAPREGVGAWAVFGKNMKNLPQSGDGVPIAGRLVAQAAEDAPMFKEIQDQIRVYLGKGGSTTEGEVETQILALKIGSKKTLAQKYPDRTAVKAVDAYIESKQKVIRECRANLASVKQTLEEVTATNDKTKRELDDITTQLASAQEALQKAKDGPPLPPAQEKAVTTAVANVDNARAATTGATNGVDDSSEGVDDAQAKIVAASKAMSKHDGASPDPTNAVEHWTSAMNALFALVDKTIVTNETMLLYTDAKVNKSIKSGIDSWTAFANGVKAIVNMCIARTSKGGLWQAKGPYTPSGNRVTAARNFTAAWYLLYQVTSEITAPFNTNDAFTKNVFVVARGLLYVDFLFMLSARPFAVEANKSKNKKTFGETVTAAWTAVGIGKKEDYMSEKMGATDPFHELGDMQAWAWTEWYLDEGVWADFEKHGVTMKSVKTVDVTKLKVIS